MSGSIIRGQTFQGAVNLKQDDGVDTANVQPFAISNSDQIDARFPGATATVVLSTLNVGEITITNGPAGEFTYKGDPVKSLLLAVGTKLSIDVIVTRGTDVFIFEKQKILNIKDQDNP